MSDLYPTDLDLLPEGLVELIKPELVPGETLHWASRSQPKTDGRGSPRGFAWALGLGLPGLVGVIYASRIGETVQPAFAWLMLLGVPATIIGGITLLGSIVGVAARRNQVRQQRLRYYALTDRRAIIWLPEPGSEAILVRSIPWSAIKPEDIRRSEYPDGSGSILFREAYDDVAGFVGVDGARRVEWLLRELMGSPIQDRAAT